jgi:2-aminoadipate transaminase
MLGTEILAHRTSGMGASAIREILKVVSQPGMVSLAGGIPAPGSFPLNLMADLTEKVLEKYSASAFQYDTTEGFGPLREALVDHLSVKGVKAGSDEILVASGSQGVLNSLGMVAISKGDRVAVEAPTYLGALQAFTPYEPDYVRIETDDDGVIPESLEAILKSGPVKFIYLVPTFQNPTGRCLPLDRRQAVARLARQYNVLVVEDDPYSDLRYRGKPIASIHSMAPDHVLYIGTLSKVFAPGLRIGYCVAPEPIRRWLVIVKQGIDLHTGTFNQALAAEYLTGGYLAGHLPKIIQLYRPRQDAMLNAIEDHFPDACHWNHPEGGMFVWVRGPSGMDMETLYWKSVERNVAFVPGSYFFAHRGEGRETMRLNFTMADEKTLSRAVRILGETLHEELYALQ